MTSASLSAQSVRKYVDSAGCIVCRMSPGGSMQVLLVGGKAAEHTYRGFPKGRLKAEECPEMAALRETREETGIVVELLALAGISRYEFVSIKGHEIYKTVRFYLARAVGGTFRDKDDEHYDVTWVNLDEALGTLSYRADRQILQNARNLIEQVSLYRNLLAENPPTA